MKNTCTEFAFSTTFREEDIRGVGKKFSDKCHNFGLVDQRHKSDKWS